MPLRTDEPQRPSRPSRIQVGDLIGPGDPLAASRAARSLLEFVEAQLSKLADRDA